MMPPKPPKPPATNPTDRTNVQEAKRRPDGRSIMHPIELPLDSPQGLEQLLAATQAGLDPDALLWARLIAHQLRSGCLEALGLTRAELAQLLQRHFAGRSLQAPGRLLPVILTEPEVGFTAGLHELLARYRSIESRESGLLAKVVALACLRPDHLWRDLGLACRDDVSAMFDRHFPTLSSRNVSEMRWKKFLAFELSAQRGLAATAAPGCAGCEDQAFCYPERLPDAAV
jgi:nitrogen fixation protein NifQ